MSTDSKLDTSKNTAKSIFGGDITPLNQSNQIGTLPTVKKPKAKLFNLS